MKASEAHPQPPAEAPANEPGEIGPGPFAELRTRIFVPVAVALGAALYLLLLGAIELGLVDTGAPLAMEVATLAVAYGAIALSIWIACRLAGVALPRLLGGKPPSAFAWSSVVGLLAVGLAFSAGSWYLWGSALSYLAPGILARLIDALAAAEVPAGASQATAILWHFEIVLLAPVVEEFLFRGVLVNRWGAKWGVRAGVLASSGLFACMHANVLGVFVLGLVAALLYVRTGTLLVPIALHVGNNLTATVLGELVDLGGTLEVEHVRASVPEGLALVAVAAPVLYLYARRSWPGRDAEIPYMKARR